MAGFTCPYCGMIMALNAETHRLRRPSFEHDDGQHFGTTGYYVDSSTVEVDFFKCPNCAEYSVTASGKGSDVKAINVMIKPNSLAKQYPEYIPLQIRKDYEEACAVLYLSPKSSATLSRRCLQGMIHDFWGVQKSTLFEELSELKDKLQPDLWMAINGLRQLGNIGAHMEKDTNLIIDIDPNEASQLIKLIELLVKEWYMNREERRILYEGIVQANEEKQAQRKG